MATLDLLTLDEAKAAVNVLNSTEHDDELPGFITAVSLRLDKFVGPIVERVISGEQYDGGARSIWLRTYPIKSVITVEEYENLELTMVTQETNVAQPDPGYLLEPYSMDGTLYGNEIHRRSAGYDCRFPRGRRNIVVSYVAGRFNDTGSVDERFKMGARLTLQNLWRSQQESQGQSGEFDVPLNAFPRVTVPKAVYDMFCDEVQEKRVLIG